MSIAFVASTLFPIHIANLGGVCITGTKKKDVRYATAACCHGNLFILIAHIGVDRRGFVVHIWMWAPYSTRESLHALERGTYGKIWP